MSAPQADQAARASGMPRVFLSSRTDGHADRLALMLRWMSERAIPRMLAPGSAVLRESEKATADAGL